MYRFMSTLASPAPEYRSAAESLAAEAVVLWRAVAHVEEVSTSCAGCGCGDMLLVTGEKASTELPANREAATRVLA